MTPHCAPLSPAAQATTAPTLPPCGESADSMQACSRITVTISGVVMRVISSLARQPVIAFDLKLCSQRDKQQVWELGDGSPEARQREAQCDGHVQRRSTERLLLRLHSAAGVDEAGWLGVRRKQAKKH